MQNYFLLLSSKFSRTFVHFLKNGFFKQNHILFSKRIVLIASSLIFWKKIPRTINKYILNLNFYYHTSPIFLKFSNFIVIPHPFFLQESMCIFLIDAHFNKQCPPFIRPPYSGQFNSSQLNFFTIKFRILCETLIIFFKNGTFLITAFYNNPPNPPNPTKPSNPSKPSKPSKPSTIFLLKNANFIVIKNAIYYYKPR